MARLRTIGTGSTGSAIGAVVSRGGNTVELFGQGHAARPISGEVVLAVPYGACSWRSSLSRSVVAVVHGAPGPRAAAGRAPSAPAMEQTVVITSGVGPHG